MLSSLNQRLAIRQNYTIHRETLKKLFFRKKTFNGTLEKQCLHLSKVNKHKNENFL